jgi:hypothetical protein
MAQLQQQQQQQAGLLLLRHAAPLSPSTRSQSCPGPASHAAEASPVAFLCHLAQAVSCCRGQQLKAVHLLLLQLQLLLLPLPQLLPVMMPLL